MNPDLKRAFGTFPLPGKVQIAHGEKTRGLAYLIIFVLLFMMLIYNLVSGLQTRMNMIEAMADGSPQGDSVQELNLSSRTLPYLALIIIVYVIAFIDAYKLKEEVKEVGKYE